MGVPYHRGQMGQTSQCTTRDTNINACACWIQISRSMELHNLQCEWLWSWEEHKYIQRKYCEDDSVTQSGKRLLERAEQQHKLLLDFYMGAYHCTHSRDQLLWSSSLSTTWTSTFASSLCPLTFNLTTYQNQEFVEDGSSGWSTS